MAKKVNLKSVRLSDQVMDSAVSEALLDLEWRTNDLSELMDELLEDKDADPELPFP